MRFWDLISLSNNHGTLAVQLIACCFISIPSSFSTILILPAISIDIIMIDGHEPRKITSLNWRLDILAGPIDGDDALPESLIIRPPGSSAATAASCVSGMASRNNSTAPWLVNLIALVNRFNMSCLIRVGSAYPFRGSSIWLSGGRMQMPFSLRLVLPSLTDQRAACCEVACLFLLAASSCSGIAMTDNTLSPVHALLVIAPPKKELDLPACQTAGARQNERSSQGGLTKKPRRLFWGACPSLQRFERD